ncbi:hypothetical protein ABKW02_24350, partial [Enterobacter cloacae]|uniref:hypothetical protein n=1 Tax=Enterobacter cloacae TaxID=550 RepID=UPI0032B019F7
FLKTQKKLCSIYYAQPLLPLMGADLHLSIEGMGMVPLRASAVGFADQSHLGRCNRIPSSRSYVINMLDGDALREL